MQRQQFYCFDGLSTKVIGRYVAETKSCCTTIDPPTISETKVKPWSAVEDDKLPSGVFHRNVVQDQDGATLDLVTK